MGALLQLGVCDQDGALAEVETAAAWVWHAAAAAAMADEGNYFEVSLEEEDLVLLSEPVELWNADCSKQPALLFTLTPHAYLPAAPLSFTCFLDSFTALETALT